MSAEMTRRNFVGVAAGAAATMALVACAGETTEPEAEAEGEAEGEPEPVPAAEPEPEAVVENPVDLVLKNAVVYTIDDAWTIASAVAIKGDTIMAVGSDADMEAFVGPDTEVMDLGGQMLMPGFMNGHDHVASEQEFDLGSLMLNSVTDEIDLDVYMQLIHEYVDANPGLPYYDIGGFDLRAWPNSAPDNQRLNEEFPDSPIYGTDVSGHGNIVNQALLDLAGVDENTPVTQGGTVYHYEDGTLNGYFSDAFDMFINLPALPGPTDEQLIEAFEKFQALANSYGITGFHDGGNDEDKVRLYHSYSETGDMSLRLSLPIWARPAEVDPKELPAVTLDILDRCQAFSNDFIHVNSAKTAIDGVPEGKSAFMLEPYAPTAGVDPDFRSYPKWESQDDLNEFVKTLNAAGYSVLIHTMGDGGAHMDVEAFEYSYNANGENFGTKRNTIIHATIIDPDDIVRCGKMGIFNGTQAVWFYVDPQFGALELQMFGEERFNREYNMRTRLDAGMFMTSSADYFVTPDFIPLHSIQCGVTQGSPYPGEAGDPSFVRNADEGVTVEEMMKCHTIWCARQMGMDDILGTIEVGKKADFVVLDQDLTKVDPLKIAEINVVYTIFGGKVVYEG